MLKYVIENGEVTITGYKDQFVKSIVIPETIESYPVTMITSFETPYLEELSIPNSVKHITYYILRNNGKLKFINNQPIINGFCVINNHFIYKDGKFCEIIFNVGNDYRLKYSSLYECYYKYLIDYNHINEIFM